MGNVREVATCAASEKTWEAVFNRAGVTAPITSCTLGATVLVGVEYVNGLLLVEDDGVAADRKFCLFSERSDAVGGGRIGADAAEGGRGRDNEETEGEGGTE